MTRYSHTEAPVSKRTAIVMAHNILYRYKLTGRRKNYKKNALKILWLVFTVIIRCSSYSIDWTERMHSLCAHKSIPQAAAEELICVHGAHFTFKWYCKHVDEHDDDHSDVLDNTDAIYGQNFGYSTLLCCYWPSQCFYRHSCKGSKKIFFWCCCLLIIHMHKRKKKNIRKNNRNQHKTTWKKAKKTQKMIDLLIWARDVTIWFGCRRRFVLLWTKSKRTHSRYIVHNQIIHHFVHLLECFQIVGVHGALPRRLAAVRCFGHIIQFDLRCVSVWEIVNWMVFIGVLRFVGYISDYGR